MSFFKQINTQKMQCAKKPETQDSDNDDSEKDENGGCLPKKSDVKPEDSDK